MLSFVYSYNLLYRVNCPVSVVYQVATVFIYSQGRSIKLRPLKHVYIDR